MARYTNINGTSDNSCKCGSWLKHWEYYTKVKATFCSVDGCLYQNIVGAHVQKYQSIDRGWYIIPLCNLHNSNAWKFLEVDDNIPAISANVSLTCGR